MADEPSSKYFEKKMKRGWKNVKGACLTSLWEHLENHLFFSSFPTMHNLLGKSLPD
jgi:hypothetical protein